MRRSAWMTVALGSVALALPGSVSAAGPVALSAVSATVQNPGDSGQICVMLSTGGNPVAGTQNKLVWDGNCATLTSASNCVAVGGHGKEVSADSDHQNDFTVHVLVLSLANTNPIPDGPLYCCAFESEAEPGQCCNITVVDANSSTPAGRPITTMGNSAQICTSSSSGQAAHDFGGNSGMPVSGGNEAGAAAGSGSTSSAPPPAGGSGAPAPPPVQVLQGGGARVDSPAAPAVPPVEAPQTPATGQPAGQAAPGVPAPGVPAAAVPAAAVPAVAAATSVATLAATRPPPAGTPTARAAAPVATQAVPAPTKAAPAATKAAAAQDPPAAASSSGLAGCEVGDIATSMPLLGLGALVVLARAVIRRRR